MTRTVRRTLLLITATISAALLAAFLAIPGVARDPVVPDDAEALARWIVEHPADAIAASALSDAALDSALPRRREVWHASYEHARDLSPIRPNAPAGFVRAGLFHWYELENADRQRVLEVAAPLMRDPRFFERMYRPLWELTRDFEYLRSVAPETVGALATLRDLAVSRGLFAEYRELRMAIRRERVEALDARRDSWTNPMELIHLLPERLDTGHAPLVRAILEELDRKPFSPAELSGRVEELIRLAIDRDIGPLRGIQPLLDVPGSMSDALRARAALALDRPAIASRIEITTAVPGAVEWVPYHLERARHDARQGDAAAARAQLARAASAGMTPQLLAAQIDVATILDDAAAAAASRAQLAKLATPAWTKTCGMNELCDRARTARYVAGRNGVVAVTLTTTQSDETAPYVEIYANDALVAEGMVAESATFAVPLAHGVHELEVRLINRTTPNGVQRRLRLS